MGAVDPIPTLRNWLITLPSLYPHFGQGEGARIWGSKDWEKRYAPASDGPALLFSVRSGGAWPGNDYLNIVSVQYQIASNDEALSRHIARDLFLAINGQSGPGIKQTLREVHEQPLPDTQDGWHIVFTAYQHWLWNTE